MFIVNVEAAIFKEDRWLIIERSIKEEHAGGLLSLVGGKVEIEGNSADILERTVKREIYEEVGINIKDKLEYIHSTTFVTDLNEHVVDIVFLCEYDSGEAYTKSPDEVENVYWMNSNEIMSHLKSPIYLKESIRRAEITLKKYK
ncbi:NUDIX hydrolase [Bacillus sp. EAC]|uniref:NUDIX hydrolase n=1 Tax=Bacillus sp. EAC TaxID=1978338 RepID=UPI000B449B4F|nr:NUDIX domain-containing protein [Bacillus sp. EAC]